MTSKNVESNKLLGMMLMIHQYSINIAHSCLSKVILDFERQQNLIYPFVHQMIVMANKFIIGYCKRTHMMKHQQIHRAHVRARLCEKEREREFIHHKGGFIALRIQ